MDAVTLARIQFALTVGFHFIFPPLTIGLAWLIFGMMTKWRRTGDALYRQMARFWIKLFSLSFVVGVATGITMEFQFGTNWSRYARYVGDIFGAPLAIEAVVAFFLESSFLAVLVFGWGRVSERILWLASGMVALGATLSAFWIIVANSWMQTPVGFRIIHGRAELTDFAAAVFNPSTTPRFLHTVDGALTTGSFFMLGLSAWFLLRGRHVEFAKASLRTALVVAFLASVSQIGLGHLHAVQVARTQPEKIAAFEGLFKTQRRAPVHLFGFPDVNSETVKVAVALPPWLSVLAFGDPNAVVKGLEAFPKSEWPPLAPTFFPFHLMVGLGTLFAALAAGGILLLWRGKLYDNKLFLKAALWAVPLPFIANELGWVAAEVGRQPWAVYRILKTADAVSVTVPPGQILFSIIMLTLIYALLFGAWMVLLRRELEHGPEPIEKKEVPA